jgi:hypothetical protein
MNNKLMCIAVYSGGDNKYKSIRDNFCENLKQFKSEIADVIVFDVGTKSGDWQSEGFLETVYKKLSFTRYFLNEGFDVFCTDLDIFYLKDPLPLMNTLLKKYDIVGQNDFDRLCTGFYMVKSTDKTISLFDTSDELKLDGEQSDQNYIDTKLKLEEFKNISVFKLDQDYFPNGFRWFRRHKTIDPYIVHYNCIDSIEEKIEKMKKYKHWLI